MSEPIELIIFDCDGVLVDSERIAIRIDAMILEQLGWSLTESEIVERFVGRSTESITAAIEAHIGRPLPSDWDDGFEPLYREALARELTPIDGIIEALDAIALPTCVASSGSHDKMRFTLGLTGLYERFAGRIFSASEVARGKPEPDLFLHVAAQMGVAPTACVWSSKTASPECGPDMPRGCACSGTPEASPRLRASRLTPRWSSTTCVTCRRCSRGGHRVQGTRGEWRGRSME